MKFVGWFIPLFLLIAAAALGQNLPQAQATPLETLPEKPNSLTICAGNVPPDGMVITATGTAPTCAGACRARTVEPVQGAVMVICAGQPIPEYYETQSTTTTPACNCVGEEDNAYLIRRMAGAPTPTPAEVTPRGLPPSVR